MKNLLDRLSAAMKHAVCDIVTEYRLLTAPLCELPQHYARGVESPYHSAPPSPVPMVIQGTAVIILTNHVNTTSQSLDTSLCQSYAPITECSISFTCS